MADRNYIELGGTSTAHRLPVRTQNLRSGYPQPFIPRFGPGDKQFTGGVPPFEAQGQRLWGKGMDAKHGSVVDNQGFRRSVNVDTEWHDRVTLARAAGSGVHMGLLAAPRKWRFVRVPFAGYLYAYSMVSNEVYYFTTGGSWTALTLPGVWTGTTPTGWLSDCICKVGSAVVLLLGSDTGLTLQIAAGTPTSSAQVGNFSSGSPNLAGGIRDIEVYNSVVHLGGSNSSGLATVCTQDSAGTTLTTKFELGDFSTGGAARVQCLLRRFVDSDNSPNQLHVIVTQLNSSSLPSSAIHLMYDGTSLRELKRWEDNSPVCAIEVDVTGARAILFGMQKYGSIWRFAGDYTEILRLDNPDRSYSVPMEQLVQFGKRVAAAISDTTNGMSLLLYDGQGWVQSTAPAPGETGAGGYALAVYRERLYLLTHTVDNYIFPIENASDATPYATAGHIETSLYDGDLREVIKEYLAVRLVHSPLASGETITVSYLLDDNEGGDYVVTEDFDTAELKHADTTGLWDTTNGRGTIPGTGAKLPTDSASAAYAGRATDFTTSKTPASLIAGGSAFSAADETAAASSDNSRVTTSTTVGSADQSHTGESGSADLGGLRHAQTFQSGASATLSAIILKARNTVAGQTSQIRAKLYATSGGLPTGGVLATSETVTISSDTAAECTLNFYTPATLVSGTTYAFEVELVTAPASGALRLSASLTSGYANGAHVSYVGSWTSVGNDLYFKTYTGGTFGRPYQVYQFDYSSGAPTSIPVRWEGYGGDASAGNGGGSVYVWNATDGLWEEIDTWTSGDTDSVETHTVSSSISEYLDGAGKLYVLAITTYAGTNALASRVVSDHCQIDGNYSTVVTYYLYSTEIDVVSSGNIGNLTLTATATANGGTIAYAVSADGGVTWEAVTSGVQKTSWTSAGNQLRFRVALTSASATSAPYVSTLVIQYTPPAASSVGYVELGSNAVDNSTRTRLAFPDAVYGYMVGLKLALAGGGSTTPELYSVALEYLVSPDTRKIYSCDLDLRENFVYQPDGVVETRTPTEMWDALIAFKDQHRRPSLTWTDGSTVSQVTFARPNIEYVHMGGPSDRSEFTMRRVPLQLITVEA